MDLKNIWGSEGREPLRLQDIGLPKILVIVAVGIVLLVLSLPGTGGSQKKIGKQENSSDVTSEEASEQIALDAMEQYNKKIEKELCELLRKVDGVGDVQVMITLASSEERVTLQMILQQRKVQERMEPGPNGRRNQRQRKVFLSAKMDRIRHIWCRY